MNPGIELRLAIPGGTSISPPKLQFRVANDLGVWQEWKNVPIVVIPCPAALKEQRRREAFDSLPDDYEVN